MDENVRDKYYLMMQAACNLGLKVYWIKMYWFPIETVLYNLR